VLPPGRLVEQAQNPQAILVINGRHGVGVADVVDPRNMLVANALDAM